MVVTTMGYPVLEVDMIVLSRINLHPGHTPEDIARMLRAEDDVDEIASAVRNSQPPGSSSR